ncbi:MULTISPECIES: non-ribosomal peptide synthetase [unclassified Pseudoalteromonas]|uniref:non-ribosomal peptide synthetase n=1 Tax=unclassified Pseudoalteromonas TaxID=194690 RepID=UPI002097C796|nr:non-ribosomal peptide synthetase [Pseudoalteromonas sp. XMcav2-N]MCO7189534.1 amino acid adenylation domain-containing protein [Pseudoalteromonas sp. XMcav2-N]
MENSAIEALLAELDGQGIYVYLQEGRLKLRTHLATVPEAQLNKIKENKSALIDYMQANHQKQGALSFSQQGIWLIDQYHGGEVAYTMAGLLKLSHPITKAQLEAAINTLLVRHDILRSQFFATEQGGCQRVNAELSLKVMSLSVAEPVTRAKIEAHVQPYLQQGFDLQKALPVRAALISGDEQTRGQWVYLMLHHLVVDGWSVQLLVNELLDVLQNTATEQAAPAPLQYLDYVHWEKRFVQSEAYQQQHAYWQKQLEGFTPFALPTSFARQAQPSFQGASHQFILNDEQFPRFESCCQQLGITVFAGLLSVFYALLYRYSQQQDITVGVPVLGREHSEFESMIGCFIHTLPLRQQITAEMSFSELARNTLTQVTRALENQSVSQDALAKLADTSQLFSVLFNYNAVPTTPLRSGSLEAELFTLNNHSAKVDLTLTLTTRGKAMVAELEYNVALFSGELIAQIGEDFQALFRAFSGDQSMPLSDAQLPSVKLAQQLLTTEPPRRAAPLVLPQILAHAQSRPAHAALVSASDPAQSLSYAELDEHSASLASALDDTIQSDDIVAVLVNRQVKSLVALLGVMRAGAAYLPIDQETPVQRVIEIMQLAGSHTLVVVDAQAVQADTKATLDECGLLVRSYDELVQHNNNVGIVDKTSPCDLAYVIFTSGSTGKPKGVAISHGALASYCDSISQCIEFSSHTRSGVVTGLATDLCLTGIYPVLMQGGTVVMPTELALPDPQQLVEMLSKQQVNMLKITPSFARELLPQIAALKENQPAIEKWVLGGEALDVSLVSDLREHYPSAHIVNHYGPSETCIGVTTHAISDQVPSNIEHYPIGKPLTHVNLQVLDKRAHPVPVGMPGELYIGGTSLADGYLRAPQLTEQYFVRCQSEYTGAERFYRSGDRVRLTHQGTLEYLGRLDSQLKIRGYRIDISEIEAKLTGLTSIKAAAVVAIKQSGIDTLVAYFVAADQETPVTATALRDTLSKSLPQAMIPSHFVALAQLPVLGNAKVDRKQLAARPLNYERSYTPLSTALQQQLATLFAELTGVSQVAADDDFFSIGGHSLLAMRLANCIRARFERVLSLQAIFANPTVEKLERCLLAQDILVGHTLASIDQSGEHPLSFAQQRIWFVDQMQGHSKQYNLQGAFTIKGELDIEALSQAFEQVVQQHTILRFNYGQNAQNEPFQYLNSGLNFALKQQDLSHVDDEVQADTLRSLLAEDYHTTFDLSQDLLLRAQLLKLDEQLFVLIVTMHHIVSDGWSIGVLCRALEAAYQAAVEHRTPAYTPLNHSYIDYVHWQRHLVSQPQWQTSVDYWQSQLANLPRVHELPLDNARENRVISGGALYCCELPKELSATLRQFVSTNGQTLFGVLECVFALWMSRLSGQSDLVLGTPVAGRELSELEAVIGNFINTLVLRHRIEPELTFTDVLAQCNETLQNALSHQHIPFDALVETLNSERSLGIHPLVQVVFRVNNQVNEALKLDGLDVTVNDTGVRSAKLDLEVSVIDSGDTLVVEWLYDSALWQERSIESFARQYTHLLRTCLQEPQRRISEMSLCDAKLLEQLLAYIEADNEQHSSDIGWHHHFSAIAEIQPHSVALRCNGEAFSYLEVEQRANQLAHCLLEMGFDEQSRIALLLPSGPAMVIAVLAILKARHVYVPLHYDTPEKSLSYIVEDADIVMILAFSEDTEKLIDSGTDFLFLDDLFDVESSFAGYPVSVPGNDELGESETSDAERLCYIIYTSGSTGRPKGVMITHGNLNGYLSHAMDTYLDADVTLPLAVVSTPLAFDATITALVPPLLCGGEVEIVTQGPHQLAAISELLFNSIRPRLFKLTPAHLRAIQALMDELGSNSAPHTLVIGGEALDSDLLLALRNKLPACTWVNEYGPTEATVGCSVFSLTPDLNPQTTLCYADVPIGLPNEGVAMLVVDQFDQPVPDNVPGELLIGGPVISPGYVNLETQNQAKFVTLNVADKKPMRFYRSGDLVRWQSDEQGRLAYLRYCGRTDEQIKLRGYRIDLNAICHYLRELDGVRDCAVTVDESQALLQAHVLYLNGKVPSDSHLRNHLAQYLPPYMIPGQFNRVEAIPLTANGKVDSKALMALAQQRESSTSRALDLTTLTPIQSYLYQLYSDILLTEHVDLEDSFFDLGGHSLLAIKLISQIRQQKNLDVTLPQLFKTPTIASLAQALEHCAPIAAVHAIVPVSRQQALPLSFAQQRLWLIEQLHESSTQYHMPAGFKFSGTLDKDAFSEALNALISRHEVLRTQIIQGAQHAEPVQQVSARFDLPLTHLDLTKLGERARQQRWEQAAHANATNRFDLSRDLLIRVLLVEFAQDDYRVHFNMHHIASDGWSMAILVREFIAFYRHFAEEAQYQLPAELTQPLPVQYGDFAYWQRNTWTKHANQDAVQYWLTALDGHPPLHQLPLDYPRPAMAQLSGQRHTQRLSAALTRAIHEHCKSQGVTLFMWLNTVFSLLVQRYSQTDDVVIGSPVAGREHNEVANLIGFFVNTLVIRTRTQPGQSFNQLLAQQKQVILDAFKHQALPFEQLVEALKPERNLGHQPIFQILFALQNNETTDLVLPQLHIEVEAPAEPMMKFDLEVNAIEKGDGIELEWNYCSALFKPATMAALAESFEILISAILKAPEHKVQCLPVMTQQAQHQLVNMRGPVTAVPAQCIHSQISAKAHLADSQLAVRDADSCMLSYAALEQKASALASYLLEQGVKPGMRIALCLNAGCDQVVAMLAAFKVRSAYVPVDPTLPASRAQFIICDSGASWLLTHSKLMTQLKPIIDAATQPPLSVLEIDQPNSWLPKQTREQFPRSEHSDLAYVIYTSGTTGQPKGVAITHANLALYLDHARHDYFNDTISFSVVSTPLAFDATVTAIWPALLQGVCIDMLADDERMLKELANRLCQEIAGVFKLTPAHLQGVVSVLKQCALAEERSFNGAHQVVVGGEALPVSLVAQLSERLPNVEWINEYGPTEATVGTSTFRCDKRQIAALNAQPHSQVPIGQPIANTHLLVLDEQMQPVPAGVTGELYIGGNNLAQGYLNRTELSDEKFVWLPFGAKQSEQRFYRSGDLVRWSINDDGTPGALVFCHRADSQIKLRGYRIEPEEIAHQLQQLPGIEQAVVLLNEAGDNLEAYLLSDLAERTEMPTLAEPALASEWSAHLSQSLPAYMLPYRYVLTETLPLTANGKVDVRALHALGAQCASSANNVVAPRNDMELTLVEILASVLNVETLGIEDNFFSLGGHSLLATQCIGLIEAQLGVSMSVRILFERPTVAALAQWIEIHQAMAQQAQDDNENDTSEEMFL